MWKFFKTILVFIATFLVWALIIQSLPETSFFKSISGPIQIIGTIFGPPIIISLIYIFRKREENSLSKESLVEQLNEEENILANRKFQHKNFIGAKVTWKFNEDGTKVNVKAGWLGINTVNSTISIEKLGEGKFVGKGLISQKFTIEGSQIKTGSVILNEI